MLNYSSIVCKGMFLDKNKKKDFNFSLHKEINYLCLNIMELCLQNLITQFFFLISFSKIT